MATWLLWALALLASAAGQETCRQAYANFRRWHKQTRLPKTFSRTKLQQQVQPFWGGGLFPCRPPCRDGMPATFRLGMHYEDRNTLLGFMVEATKDVESGTQKT